MSDQPTPVHAGPPFGSALTPCCHASPLELPRDHRVTYNLGDVTCGHPERQTWKRIEFEVAGAVEQLVVIDVDDRGIVQIEEAVLAQLLVDAGWERTA